MTDAELVPFLKTAFLPFAKGFAAEPGAVTLTVVCTPQEVSGTLHYAASDHAALTEGSMTDVDIERAFRTLAQWNDGRPAVLVIPPRRERGPR